MNVLCLLFVSLYMKSISCSQVGCLTGRHPHRSIQREVQSVYNRNSGIKIPKKIPMTLESVGITKAHQIDELDISTCNKRILKQQYRQQLGLREEKTIIKLLEKELHTHVKEDKSTYTKELCDGWILTGVVDGFIGDNLVLECKNREDRFFDALEGYEKIQCHAYMFITGRKGCLFVEKVGEESDELRYRKIPFDENYWDMIMADLQKVIELYTKIESKSATWVENFFNAKNSEKVKQLWMDKLDESNYFRF